MPNLAAWNRRSPSQIETGCAGRNRRHVVDQPFVQEGDGLGLRCAASEHRLGVGEHDVLGVLDEPVVLGVEDMVDGGQADILVGAAVAGDEVRVEQFVVVDRRSALPGLPRPISMSPSARPSGTALWAMSARKAWPVRIAAARLTETSGRRIGRGHADESSAVFGMPVAADADDDLREAVRAGNEVAVRVGREQRNVADVVVDQLDAENVARLRLEVGPGRHAAIAALDQLAGRDRVAAASNTYWRRNT